MTKTLVIHPSDPSTDFLKPIYNGKGFTVINTFTSNREIREQIKLNDRIICLGHGCSNGLFNIGFGGLIINSTHVDLLRKKELILIWCNADQFVLRYGLHGFYTGMFCSEVRECQWFDINTDQSKVNYSNDLFVSAVEKTIESKDLNEVLKECKNTYVGECPVIQYNSERLYYKSNKGVIV